MSLNVELLLAAKQRMIDNPENVDMGTYKCGSVGCLAFHICAAAERVDVPWMAIPFIACALIGIEEDERLDLFCPGTDGDLIYQNPGTPEHVARIAKHIDDFIAREVGQ